jgi:hypothetical protein
MECAVSLQTFGVKMFSRSALDTRAVRFIAAYERAAQIAVPAAENAGDDPDLIAKTAYFSIIYKFGYLILF